MRLKKVENHWVGGFTSWEPPMQQQPVVSGIFDALATSQQDVLLRSSEASRGRLAKCAPALRYSGHRGGHRSPQENSEQAGGAPGSSQGIEGLQAGQQHYWMVPLQAVEAVRFAGRVSSWSTKDPIKLPPDYAQFKGMSHVLDKYQLWRHIYSTDYYYIYNITCFYSFKII